MMTISLLGYEDTIEAVVERFEAEVLSQTWYSADCPEGSTTQIDYTVPADPVLEQHALDWIRATIAQGLLQQADLTVCGANTERSTSISQDGRERSTTWP